MALNQIDAWLFSAIAASSNPAVKQDAPQAARPLPPRVCRAWHVTMSVKVRQPGFRRAEG